METQEPNIDESLDEIFKAWQSEIKTGMPGLITEVDLNQQWVTVQPSFNRTFLDDNDNEVQKNYPVIHNVPLKFPRWGGFLITFPVKVGDKVWLNFAERSLDTYKDSNGSDIVDPKINNMHDINDATAIFGFSTRNNKVNNYHNENLVLRSESGDVEIHLTPSKEVHIKADKVKIGSLSAGIEVAKGDKSDINFNEIGAWIELVNTALGALGITLPDVTIDSVKSSKVYIDA